MPTWETADRFDRDYKGLSAAERKAFKAAVTKFIEDLKSDRGFRKGLRVKGIQGAGGVFEMTWAADGRATFQFGDSIDEGEPHIIWRRVAAHEVIS